MNDNNDHEPGRFAWAKLNAYGFVLAGLAVLATRDLIRPAGTELARLTGDIPPGQYLWAIAFTLAGLLLLVGFLFTDRIAETAALLLLTGGVVAQAVVAFRLLGWTDFTLTRLALIWILGGCAWARISVLWAKDGVAVNIAPRKRKKGRR